MAVPLSRDQKLGLIQLYYDVQDELAEIHHEIDEINARRRGQAEILVENGRRGRKRKARSISARPWLARRRLKKCQYQLLMEELRQICSFGLPLG
jgi:hypothetical protein